MDGLLKFTFVESSGSSGTQRWQPICSEQIDCHLIKFLLTLCAPARIDTPAARAARRIKQVDAEMNEARQPP